MLAMLITAHAKSEKSDNRIVNIITNQSTEGDSSSLEHIIITVLS